MPLVTALSQCLTLQTLRPGGSCVTPVNPHSLWLETNLWEGSGEVADPGSLEGILPWWLQNTLSASAVGNVCSDQWPELHLQDTAELF